MSPFCIDAFRRRSASRRLAKRETIYLKTRRGAVNRGLGESPDETLEGTFGK